MYVKAFRPEYVRLFYRSRCAFTDGIPPLLYIAADLPVAQPVANLLLNPFFDECLTSFHGKPFHTRKLFPPPVSIMIQGENVQSLNVFLRLYEVFRTFL